MNQKIQGLKIDITTKIKDDFNLKMEEVLSCCESPIEKLMLLYLYSYFQKESDRIYRVPQYHIDFIFDDYCMPDPSDNKERQFLENNNYVKIGYELYNKFIGFKIKDLFNEPMFVFKSNHDDPFFKADKRLKYGDINREFAIIPQHIQTIDGVNYRIDIAIILNRKNGKGEIVETTKIAIECDGHDYHTSKEQKTKDDRRARLLKINGWKEVFRYSGSEIFALDSEIEIKPGTIGEIMDEIIKMLYV